MRRRDIALFVSETPERDMLLSYFSLPRVLRVVRAWCRAVGCCGGGGGGGGGWMVAICDDYHYVRWDGCAAAAEAEAAVSVGWLGYRAGRMGGTQRQENKSRKPKAAHPHHWH